ncbi:MAG TPA: MFS transporter [Gammaproteobacteria bacterium]|nr:MFS transporter [Gammaproteobacteria bacterium]
MSTTSTGQSGEVTDPLLDKPSYKWYVVGVLVLGYVFNVIDRGALGVLVQPIKAELQISDTAMGLLTGLAFALFYSVMGVPIARLADRWSRVNVLTLAITLWTIATALCGTAYNYASLFVFRSFTGVGEAGGSPPSHSLISDYFPLSKRATALAVYAMSVPIGTSIGSIASGWGNVYFGWRWTFVMVGLPGLLVALLVKLTIKEPPRGYSDGQQKKAPAPPFLGVCKFLLSRRSFMHMSLAAALHSVVWYAGTSWNTAFLMRYHELNSGVAGSYIGVFALIGALGSFTGGFLSDRMSTKKNDKRWYMWVPGIACVIMVPFTLLAYRSPSMTVVVPAWSIMVVLASMFFGPSFAVAQSIATVRMRAVAASVLLFIQTIIGLTIGPVLVGAISDYFAPSVGDAVSLSYGLMIVGLTNLWAALHYYLGSRTYRDDLAETAKLNVAAAA